ncbi:glycosyltransferase [Arthrobacter halodurans]|uniref:Glycosyltransferase n=1 Tax=Arthrobacter halodurans TaxID=516699 RepID=A0ABV4UK45_9MICC
MQIAIIVPRLRGGGAESVARQWVATLIQHGHECEILTTHHFDDTNDATFDFPVTSLNSRAGFVRSILNLQRGIRRRQYDAVLGVMPYANLVAIFASAVLPRRLAPRVIISEHTIHSRYTVGVGLGPRIQWLLARLTYRMADDAIAVSHPVAASLARLGVRRDKTWVVLNSIFPNLPPSVAARPPVSTFDSIGIVVPGRLMPAKRPEMALHVAKLVRRMTGKEVVVTYFGDGPEKPHLESLSTELGVQAVHRGWVDHWLDECPPNGVVLISSPLEGLGNVLVEAASRRIPSVASSKALGVADACIDGVSGILSLDDTPMSYAKGVVEAMRLEVPDLSPWLNNFTQDSAYAGISNILGDEQS